MKLKESSFRTRALGDLLRRRLHEEMSALERKKLKRPSGWTYLDEYVDRLIVEAIHGGKQWAFLEIGERIDPKPKRVEVSGAGGGPIQVTTLVEAVRLAVREEKTVGTGRETPKLDARATSQPSESAA